MTNEASEQLWVDPDVLKRIDDALEEDIGTGDATSVALVPEAARVRAEIVARDAVVVAGGGVASAIFRRVDEGIRCERRVDDGDRASADEVILAAEGPARAILTAERTALNFMQRMTGIATMTARFVERAAPYGVAILDTRKTSPGLRPFEKYAVRCGGGANHRMGLFDRVLIKDNHRRLWRAAGTLAEAVNAAREAFPNLPVEVEVETIADLRDVLRASPEWVLLDNMPAATMVEAVRVRADTPTRLEASGGITLDTIEEAAGSGVDAISLGCLTHSAPAADLSLELAL